MKRLTLLLCILVISISCKEKQQNKELDSDPMAKSEIPEPSIDAQEEWTILFDGSSFDNWKSYLADGVPDSWKIEDGAMVFYPPKEKKNGVSHNLVTKNDYTNFVLSLEWKIAEGGNSGIFWGVKEDDKFGQPYETGPEIQVLDNEKHPDAKNGTTHQAGSLYDMVPPSEDVTKPVGEWNVCVITIDHNQNKGSVQLNGVEVAAFPLANEAWNAMVAKSKFNGWEGFGKFTTGKIGLQDHGDQVAFRNIMIKEL